MFGMHFAHCAYFLNGIIAFRSFDHNSTVHIYKTKQASPRQTNVTKKKITEMKRKSTRVTKFNGHCPSLSSCDCVQSVSKKKDLSSLGTIKIYTHDKKNLKTNKRSSREEKKKRSDNQNDDPFVRADRNHLCSYMVFSVVLHFIIVIMCYMYKCVCECTNVYGISLLFSFPFRCGRFYLLYLVW